jgi:hypothetical protein
LQLAGGKLSLSIDALLIIEQQSKNDAELQNNLAVADECGNLGKVRKIGISYCVESFQIALLLVRQMKLFYK